MATKSVSGRGETFTRVRPEVASIDQYVKLLRIEGPDGEVDIDECLIQQPELYWHVANEAAIAVSERDTVKLDLEIATAAEDDRLRGMADRNKEKVTEAGIRQQLAGSTKLQALERKLLEKKLLADSWEALHQSYRQRSYALSGLTDRSIARMGGGDSAVDHLANRRREEAGKQRRRMRGV